MIIMTLVIVFLNIHVKINPRDAVQAQKIAWGLFSPNVRALYLGMTMLLDSKPERIGTDFFNIDA
jgi:hypothetical protein